MGLLRKRGVLAIILITLIVFILGCQKQIDVVPSKVHPYLINFLNLSETQLPTFLINPDGTWNVLVTCKENLSFTQCENTIKKYGNIVNRSLFDSYVVKLAKNSIYDLAGENAIKFIEKPPGKTISEILLNTTIEKIHTNFLNRVHVVFEVNRELTDVQREYLKRKDFLYVKYIGGNNYIFSIPSSKINELQELELIKRVKDIDETQKLSYPLLNNIYPDYAKVGLDKYQIIVKFYDEISFEEADNLLKNYGEVTNHNFDFNYLTIIIRTDKIDELAEEDIVERIELINPPPSVGVTQND